MSEWSESNDYHQHGGIFCDDVAALANLENAEETARQVKSPPSREQFWDYDHKPRKSLITMQQFKQCIARLGLASRPHDFDVLCKRIILV
jgi:hypothetical protein